MQTTIRELMKVGGRKVYSVTTDSTVHDALKLMAERRIGAVLVVDAGGKLSGIFSERDYARKSVEWDSIPGDTPVSDLMTAELVTIDPDNTVQECMEMVTRLRIRHLPVLDEGKLLGMVSIGDLVKAALAEKEALIDEKQSLIDKLEGYISGSMS